MIRALQNRLGICPYKKGPYKDYNWWKKTNSERVTFALFELRNTTTVEPPDSILAG